MGVQGRNLNAVETGAVALGYLLSGLWCESPSFHLLAPVLLCFLLTCCLPNIDALIYSTHLHYIALPFLYIFFSPMSNRDSVHTFSLDWVENPVIVLTERPFHPLIKERQTYGCHLDISPCSARVISASKSCPSIYVTRLISFKTALGRELAEMYL